MKKKLLNAALFVVAAYFSSPLILSQTAILHYTFNETDTGSSAANSGNGGSLYDLTLANSSGTSTDLHSFTTSSTKLFGGALDLTAASGMGSGASSGNPVAYSSTAGAVFNNATTFTITGWFNASSSPTNGARLFQTSNIFLFCSGSGSLSLQYGTSGSTDSVSSNSTVGGIVTAASGDTLNYNLTNQAVFFAVTYSYSAGSKTVTFYIGDSNTSNSLSSYTVTYTPTVTTYNSLTNLYIGGNGVGNSNTRPFDGYMDDFSIYTSTLDEATLNALRVSQIPEPNLNLLFTIISLITGVTLTIRSHFRPTQSA